jgi:hypothetical protein
MIADLQLFEEIRHLKSRAHGTISGNKLVTAEGGVVQIRNEVRGAIDHRFDLTTESSTGELAGAWVMNCADRNPSLVHGDEQAHHPVVFGERRLLIATRGSELAASTYAPMRASLDSWPDIGEAQ